MVIQTRIRGDRETEGGLAGWGLENDIDFFFLLASYGKVLMACCGTGGPAN